MNNARILGIIVLAIGFYLMYLTDKYESGYFVGVLTGAITAMGFAIIVFGKIKFWTKI